MSNSWHFRERACQFHSENYRSVANNVYLGQTYGLRLVAGGIQTGISCHLSPLSAGQDTALDTVDDRWAGWCPHLQKSCLRETQGPASEHIEQPVNSRLNLRLLALNYVSGCLASFLGRAGQPVWLPVVTDQACAPVNWSCADQEEEAAEQRATSTQPSVACPRPSLVCRALAYISFLLFKQVVSLWKKHHRTPFKCTALVVGL